MISAPLVSVIMPVHNCEGYVQAAIESILKQDYTNWELLICDDASTDGSVEVIRKFSDSRIRLFLNTKNVGSLLTRSFLAKHVKGELIALQDADDISRSNRLSRQVALLCEIGEVALCGTWVQYKRKGRIVRVKQTPETWAAIKSASYISNSFCSASIMFRRWLLESLPLYREYFKDIGNYDYDFTARVANAYPCRNIPEYLYVVTVRANSNSRTWNFANPLKFESAAIVRSLLSERMTSGTDSLERDDHASLQSIEQRLLAAYTSDRWLVYDRIINQYIDQRFFFNALAVSFRCFRVNMFSIRPFKLFLYIIKRFMQ